ncbi:unnamed protein product [Calypogeia fissa]
MCTFLASEEFDAVLKIRSSSQFSCQIGFHSRETVVGSGNLGVLPRCARALRISRRGRSPHSVVVLELFSLPGGHKIV